MPVSDPVLHLFLQIIIPENSLISNYIQPSKGFSVQTRIILSYVWFLILLFCLPFIYSYTFVRSEYYFLWMINFILAAILLYCIAKKEMFFIIWILGTFLGFICASILNNYIPANPTPPYAPFDYNFAIYTATFLTLVILLLIYNRFYAQKQLLLIVEQEVADRTKKIKRSSGY